MSIFFSDIKKKIERGRNAGVAGISLDVNSLFDTPAKRYAAATSGLNATGLGRGGLIKISESADGMIKFIVTATGEELDSIEEAVSLNQSLGLADVRVLGQKISSNNIYSTLLNNIRRNSDSYGAAEGMFDDIKDKIATLTDNQKQVLSRAGIDVDSLNTLQAQILTMAKDQENNSAGVISRIEAAKKSGKLNGIFIPDDGGGRMLMFSQQGADGTRKALDAYQSHLLLAEVGQGYFDTNDLASIMSKALTDPESAYEKLVKIIEKSSKRVRAYISPREVSLSGEDLGKIVGRFAGTPGIADLKLSEYTLIRDHEFEILSKFAFGQGHDFSPQVGSPDVLRRGAALQDYYRSLDAEKVVNEIIGSFDRGKLDISAMDEMKEAIKAFHVQNENLIGKEFLSGGLKQHLLGTFATTDERKIAVEGLFSSLEKSTDGFDLVNKRFIKSYVRSLKDDLRRVDAEIQNFRSSSSGFANQSQARDFEMLMATKNDLFEKIRRIENGDVYQITGRGRTKFGDKFYNIKNAVSAERFFKGENLKKYAMILSQHSLKAEVGIAGERESLILSGIGQARESVYADAVSLNFNPELFTDEGSIRAIQLHQQEVIKEFQDMLDTGVVPDKVRKMIAMQASASVDHLGAADRAAAIRNKDFAKTIDDMLRSGISPADSPALMTMVHKFYTTMAFKEKTYKGGTFFGAALPETHRFSLITEIGMMGVDSNPFKLGSPTTSAAMKLSSGATENIAEIGVFRVKGHQAILHTSAVGKYFHSLGGFDLDDKGIARVVTYEDNAGMKRLGFNIFRQPSGPEEFMFMRMMMDQDSIQGMFGHDRFKRQLKDFIASGDTLSGVDSSDLIKLQEILDADKGAIVKFNVGEIENAIARFSEQVMGSTYQLGDEAIGRLSQAGGTAPLGLKDLYEVVNGEIQEINPKYTKTGVYKVLIENEAFELEKDIRTKISQLNIDQQVKNALLNENLDTNQFLQELARIQSAGKDSEVFATVGAIVDEMVAKKMKDEAGNLGTYVNRSSVVGSALGQYSDYLKSLDPTSELFKFLTDENNIMYRAGLIAQEEAIDASVNLSVSKKFALASREFIQQNMGSINQANLSSQLQKFYGLAGTITIDDIGAQSVSSLGRIIGMTRAAGSSAQEFQKGLGLDRFAISVKYTAGDRKMLLESMVSGIEDYINRDQSNTLGAVADRDAIEAELNEYKRLLQKGTDKDIENILLKNIGLSAKSKYNTFGAANMTETARLMEDMYKGGLNKNVLDPYSKLAKSTLEEDALAAQLIDSHAEEIGRFYKVFGQEMKSLTEFEKYNLAIAKRNVGEKLLERIDAASQLQGISRSGLYNALYKTGNQVGFDPAQLLYFEGSSNISGEISAVARETLDGMLFNRRLNSIKYFEEADKTNIDALLARLMPDPDRLKSINQIKAAVETELENLLNQSASTGLSDADQLNKNILDALMEKGSNIQDAAQRQQAEYEANLIRLKMERNKLADEVGDIDAEIARRGLGDTRGTIADIADTSIGPTLSRSDRDAMNAALGLREEGSDFFKSTKYQRFSLKDFQEGGKYFDLVKSPTVRKGALAVAGLIVGSFIYSANKGRSEEDMQGPPLLPGGSPYEDALPARSLNIQDLSNQGYNMGVSYNVSLYGNRDAIASFNKSAGGLTNGNINTTMYNRIPDVGRDPYSSLASSY